MTRCSTFALSASQHSSIVKLGVASLTSEHIFVHVYPLGLTHLVAVDYLLVLSGTEAELTWCVTVLILAGCKSLTSGQVRWWKAETEGKDLV